MALKDMLKNIKNPDKINLKKDLDLFLLTTYRDIGDDGRGKSGNLHPSSISNCSRAVVYDRIGVPGVTVYKPSGRTQRIFDNGDGVHERLQKYYALMGVLFGHWRCVGCSGHGSNRVVKKVKFPGDVVESQIGAGCKFENCFIPNCPLGFPWKWEAGQEVKPLFLYKEPRFEIKEYRVSGYTDGILDLNRQRLILEIKSMRDDKWRKLTSPQKDHYEQAQTYMWGFGLDKALFQYENKNDQEIKEFIIDRDEDKIQEIKDRVNLIWNSLSTRQIPNRVCRMKTEGRWCPYSDICFNDFNDLDKYWDDYEKSLEVEGE